MAVMRFSAILHFCMKQASLSVLGLESESGHHEMSEYRYYNAHVRITVLYGDATLIFI